MKSLLLMTVLLGTADAKKRKKGEGVVVNVKVLDKEDSKPVATAQVRHPKEDLHHRVNEVTGVWYASEVLLPDGTQLHFTPGSALELEISAPGYVTQHVRYDVKRWKNKIEIELQKMDITTDIEIPLTPFDREEQRDPTSGGGGN